MGSVCPVAPNWVGPVMHFNNVGSQLAKNEEKGTNKVAVVTKPVGQKNI